MFLIFSLKGLCLKFTRRLRQLCSTFRPNPRRFYSRSRDPFQHKKKSKLYHTFSLNFMEGFHSSTDQFSGVGQRDQNGENLRAAGFKK